MPDPENLEDLMTEGDPTSTLSQQDELLLEADRIGVELRALIVKCKGLPKIEGEPYQALRYTLSRAQEYLQTGMLWLRKCITQDMRF